MKIKFLGAARHVTGSNYLLSLSSSEKYLVDCGMFQGARLQEKLNKENFQYNPETIKALFLTHAHLDHVGRVPKLVKEGFSSLVYATAPTFDLARVVLDDAVYLMKEEAEKEDEEPLYSEQDVAASFSNWRLLGYHQKIKVADDVEAEYIDAGHILGSATVKLTADGKSVVFSGDLGNPPVPFLKETQHFATADALIIESTYGGRIHEPPAEREKELKEAICQTLSHGGTLMIPTFAVERAQELLYHLNRLIEENAVPQIPVYLDSPMAIKVTQIFRRYPQFYNSHDRDLSLNDDLLQFPGLHLTQTVQSSKEINKVKGPKVVIAGSGMMHGGRILHHAIRYLPDKNSMLLIVGFQVEGSLGRRLLDGESRVKIHGQYVTVKARIKAIGAYSAHADQKGLLRSVEAFEKPPRKIFITHGELSQAQALKEKIKERFGVDSFIPAFGEEYEI